MAVSLKFHPWGEAVRQVVSRASVANPWRRLTAFLIDVVPITVLVFVVAYSFTGFQETFDSWWENREDLEVRAMFLKQRNALRFIAGVLYFLYAVVMEASRWQGTIGKRLLRTIVVNDAGERMTMPRSFERNAMKMFSVIPAFIGCVAALFHPYKQAWHDRIAHTYVLNSRARKGQ
ncbi:MAG: RDD family protein [Verrucomicrobiales bacterium]